MGQLRLALLGTPEIRHDDQVLAFRTRKALALLIYLVANKGVHSREKLAALLWPEHEEGQSRASLRSTLVSVRQALGEMSNLTPSHLLIEYDTIGFHFASDFALDLNTLQSAWELTRSASDASRRAHTREEKGSDPILSRLQQAVNLYRGDFLEGFSLHEAPDFEAWISTQRSYWHRRMDIICNRLSQEQFERGEMSQAIETASRWLTHDSFNELAYQRLMQAHLAAGDRTSALQIYDTCRAMLAKEFTARPSPETEALAESIRAQSFPRRKLLSGSQEQIFSWLAGEPPLIGRGNEHQTLVALYHTVHTNEPRVATLLGEAGIGKTRLANAFLDWARAQGADVLTGRAFEAGGHLPYQPLIEALRGRLARANTASILLTPLWLGELSRLLPELRERFPDLPLLTSDDEIARPRLFESVARLLQALASQAPLVVFIDDLQWVGASSLDLLHYLSHNFARSKVPILFLFNARSEALATMPALANWLADLERNVPVTNLTLNPLTLGETVQLIRQLSSDERSRPKENAESERFGRWIYAETGGHPFFLMETLKTFVERDILAVHPAEDGTTVIDLAPALQNEQLVRGIIPPRVREVIRNRLLHLPPNALSLLIAGAVLGGTFSFEWLCQITDIPENEGLPALEALLGGHLLAEAEKEGRLPGEERFLFTHDKIREVTYTEAGSTRRRLFHRRALETLQASSASPAKLAHHALAAGLAEAAIRLSIAAGDEAMRLFAVRDALAHYEQARRLLRQFEEDHLTEAQEHLAIPPSDLSHLYLQLGEAYELNGEFKRAESLYEEMLARAKEIHEPAMECAALNRLATLIARSSRDLPRMETLLQEALLVAESSQNPTGIAETAWNLAQTRFFTGQTMAAALPYAERALALARELNLQELIGRSLHVLASIESALGEWEQSASHAQEGQEHYAVLRNRPKEAACLGIVAVARIFGDQLQEGITLARAALKISLEMEDSPGQIQGALQLGIGLTENGTYTEARSVIEQGLALARAYQIKPLEIILLSEAGNVYRAMFALEAAQTAHREALAHSERILAPWVGRIAGELSVDCALAGQWEQASIYALQAATLRDPTNMYGGLARWYEVEALLRGGKSHLAREQVRHLSERTHNKRRYRFLALRSLAVLARWDHEIDQAIFHLEAALALAEELGLPGETWQTLATLGELYQVRKDESQARQAYTRATRIIQALADRIENEQQRLSFLTARHVQACFSVDFLR